jgi:hypothetical protein
MSWIFRCYPVWERNMESKNISFFSWNRHFRSENQLLMAISTIWGLGSRRLSLSAICGIADSPHHGCGKSSTVCIRPPNLNVREPRNRFRQLFKTSGSARQPYLSPARARICKRLWSPGIYSEKSSPPAYVA